jgi:DNA gyrase subunit A
MGVFGLDAVNDNPPAHLVVADLVENLLLLTDRGRAFHLPVERIFETELRGRGAPITSGFSLGREESLIAVLPHDDARSLVLASERGWVRRYRSSFVGPGMYQGTSLHDVAQGGPLAAACWSHTDDDLFLATVQGQALRFPGHHVRDRRGCLGIRIEEGDRVVAVTPVSEQSGVFMLGADGIGTIRLMSGFRANKAPGAGGKAAVKTDKLIGAVAIAEADDLFVISSLGKIIRFAAQEVPAKTGVVQGVNIISLRADEAVALAAGRLATAP